MNHFKKIIRFCYNSVLFCFFSTPCSLWNFHSSTRDWTHTPCSRSVESWLLNCLGSPCYNSFYMLIYKNSFPIPKGVKVRRWQIPSIFLIIDNIYPSFQRSLVNISFLGQLRSDAQPKWVSSQLSVGLLHGSHWAWGYGYRCWKLSKK